MAQHERRWRVIGLAGLLIGGGIVMASAEPQAGQGQPAPAKSATAIFAGGCFWCMEAPFEQAPGVRAVVAGYTGGAKPNPTYEDVSSGATGHAEAVQVAYDPSIITYAQLLDIFWRNIDPTQTGGQFADHGTQYRTAIFYATDEEQRLALASKQHLERSGTFSKPIATEIAPASTFYPAEEYHQDYYKKNSLRYKFYRIGSGRDAYLKKTWGSRH